eukprot:130458-Prymnesium_polylepis.1
MGALWPAAAHAPSTAARSGPIRSSRGACPMMSPTTGGGHAGVRAAGTGDGCGDDCGDGSDDASDGCSDASDGCGDASAASDDGSGGSGGSAPSKATRCITRRSAGASPPVAECQTAWLSQMAQSPARQPTGKMSAGSIARRIS